MKHFIRKVFAYSLIIIVALIAAECLTRNIPNILTFKRNVVEEEGSAIKTLIIGSSVALEDFNPKYISDSTFNMGFMAQWIPSNKQLLDRYLDKMPNVRVVIWAISVQALWNDYCYGGIAYHQNKIEHSAIASEQIYLDFSWDNNPLHHSVVCSALSQTAKRLFDYYIRREEKVTYDERGFEHCYSSDCSSGMTFKLDGYLRLENENAHKTFTKNISLMDETLAMLRKKGIQVILIMPPVYKDLVQALPRTQFEEIDEAMNLLSEKYDNVIWRNYSHDTRFTEADFFDANHLNSDIGATKFSKIVYDELLSGY